MQGRELFRLSVVAGVSAALAIWLTGAMQPSANAGTVSEPAPRTEEEDRIIRTYRAASPAVVFIATATFSVDPFDSFPEVQSREGSGSGFIVDKERGIIITNLHVIRGADKFQIFLSDGQPYEAKILGYDNEYDVAVLQLEKPPHDLAQLDFADSSRLDVGQRVLAIGNPFGLNRTLTTGIVSSLDRAVRNPNGRIMKGLIQTDAAINPGNSGGPLLDTQGRVIGINTAILSQSGDSSGIGFAIPINTIRRVLPELIATGKVLRPRIGWILVDTNQGPMVRRVLKDSPADAADVEPVERQVAGAFVQGMVRDYSRGDLIYMVEGRRVSTSDEVEEIVSQSDPRQPLKFTLRRGGLKGAERVVEIKPVLG